MAKDIKEFMEDFNSSFSDITSKYSTKKGVSSISSVGDLKKLGLDSFKGVQINDFHKQLILSAFKRDGLTAGLLAIRDRNSNFRHSHAEATAEALSEAGVDKTIFGERYYSLQTMQVGMKKFSKLVEKGKVNPEQFFKVATSLAYVADTYDKSKVGIEYLSKFHENAIPHFKGVSQLKKDGTAQFKENYETAFSALGVNVEKLAELISGKGLPTDLTHENETVKKTNINLKNEPVQNLTTNGMKQASYAGNQAYSLIVSELMRDKLVNGRSIEASFEALDDTQKELIMPLLSINGEESIKQVASSLKFKEAIIAGTVETLVSQDGFLENLSTDFIHSVPEGLTEQETLDFVRGQIIDKVLDAGVMTGAFAADNTKDFLYEIAKGCAKSEEVCGMFREVQKITNESDPAYGKTLSTASYLFHEGNIYAYSHINESFVSDKRFEEIKEEIKIAEEAPIVSEDGFTLKDNGSFVDLSEARVENFAPNSGNILVNMFNSLHNDEKIFEAQKEMKKLQITQSENKIQQSKTGLYRSLPQYAEYMKMYQGYFSRFGIPIVSSKDLIAKYSMKEQQEVVAEEIPAVSPEIPLTPPVAPTSTPTPMAPAGPSVTPVDPTATPEA